MRGAEVGEIVLRHEAAGFADFADHRDAGVAVDVFFGHRKVSFAVKGNNAHAAGVFKDPVDQRFFLIFGFDRIETDRT